MAELHTSTTFTIDGFKIVKNLGIVRGITVRSRSIIGNLGGAIQSIFGGNITIYQKLCEQTRELAFQALKDHAKELGANAIVGVRYESNEVLQGITEVLCYGTAVVVAEI